MSPDLSQIEEAEQHQPAVKLTSAQIDLAAIEVEMDFSVASVKSVLTGMPIAKFGKGQFCRSMMSAAITAKTIWRAPGLDSMEEQFNIITDQLVPFVPADLVRVTMYVPHISREGVLAAWAVKYPAMGQTMSDWTTSAIEILKIADERWVRKETGTGRFNYSIGEGITAEPKWPEGFDKQMFFDVALAKYVISASDDPILRQLRGEE